MHAQQRLARGGGRLDADQRLETLLLEVPLDRAQPVRLLGMAGAHLMREPALMRDEKSSHSKAPLVAERIGD